MDYIEYLDRLSDDVDKVDDLEVLDEMFHKLETEVKMKTEKLKRIQNENSEIKSVLDSNKNFLTELDNKSCEVQQKTEYIQELIDVQKQKLETIKNQQIQDLVQFENDVAKISEKLSGAPQVYASSSLNSALLELQDQLEAKLAELSESKELCLASQQVSRQGLDDYSHIDLAVKLHEENIAALNTQIKDLIITEEKLIRKERKELITSYFK